MAKDGQLARIASQPAPADPGLADLLDPIALEERLREARARRATALAHRPGTDRPAPPPAPPPPAAPAAPEAQPSAPARARSALAVALLIFLAGLGLGGAAVAVLALRALPERIAPAAPPPESTAASTAASAPASAPAPTVPPAPAPAPVVAAPPAIAVSRTPPPAEAVTPPAPAGLAEPASETAPPDSGAPPSLAAAPIPAPLPAPALAASLPAQVIIHFPASASASATEAREVLLAAGIGRVEIVPVRYAIGRSNIRFYHDADRAPAQALAPVVGAALGDDAPEARDFTDYATPPAPGKVEVWLAGDSGGPSRPARTRAAASAPPPPAPVASPVPEPETPMRTFPTPDAFAPPPSQAEQVERILIDRLRRAR